MREALTIVMGRVRRTTTAHTTTTICTLFSITRLIPLLTGELLPGPKTMEEGGSWNSKVIPSLVSTLTSASDTFTKAPVPPPLSGFDENNDKMLMDLSVKGRILFMDDATPVRRNVMTIK